MSNHLDDVWGSDSENNTAQHGLSYDLKKLRENHNKRGYLDGIVSSKETNLQTGFNEGFPTGANIGLQVGLIIGRLQALSYKYGDKDEGLVAEFKAAQNELRINNVLNKNQFDSEFNLPTGHELLNKWVQKTETYCIKYNVITHN